MPTAALHLHRLLVAQPVHPTSGYEDFCETEFSEVRHAEVPRGSLASVPAVEYPHRQDAAQRAPPSLPAEQSATAARRRLRPGVALALLFASKPLGNDSAEAGFARDMIVYHGQAVQMAEIIRDKTKSDSMRLLVSDISLTQQAQIGIMQGWLQAWGLPITGSEPAMAWMGHPTDGLMPGMASPDELDRLFKLPQQGGRLDLEAHDLPPRSGHTDG